MDEEALYQALVAGKLAGAALDTYAWEPPRLDNPLVELARDPMANLILTPHIGSGSAPAKTRDWRAEEFENLLAVEEKRELCYRVV